MHNLAVSLLSILFDLNATALVLLAWQSVSDYMPGPTAVSILTVPTVILALLAWQLVSDSVHL